MNSTNKLNFFLLLILTLVIAIGCNLSGDSQPNDAPIKDDDGDFVSANEDEIEGATSLTMEEEETEDETSEEETVISQSKGNRKQTTVKFGKGKVSRSYENAVIRGEKHTYYIGAKKGQRMSININALENNANFTVISPSGGFPIAGTADSGVKSFNEVLNESGRYKIIVTSIRGNATFRIYFAISAKPKIKEPPRSSGGLTKTVKFRKGKTSASYSGAVIRAESDKYLLGASAGQLMSVSINSIENNAVFSISAPNGRNLVSGTRSWSGQLPVNGKYRIIVSGTRGNATYNVHFTVR